MMSAIGGSMFPRYLMPQAGIGLVCVALVLARDYLQRCFVL
jgi:hypothetical protein